MSEPRWIGQRDQFRCGPIAVANALKWAGISCSWKRDKDRLSRLCKVTQELGTHDKHLEYALREASGRTIAVRRRKKFRIQEVINHVNGQGAVIFDFTWPYRHNMTLPVNEREGHYTLLVDIMGLEGFEFFKFINLDKEDTVTWMHRSWYRNIFSRRCVGDNAFFLRKR